MEVLYSVFIIFLRASCECRLGPLYALFVLGDGVSVIFREKGLGMLKEFRVEIRFTGLGHDVFQSIPTMSILVVKEWQLLVNGEHTKNVITWRLNSNFCKDRNKMFVNFRRFRIF